jgi:hypothetical protein
MKETNNFLAHFIFHLFGIMSVLVPIVLDIDAEMFCFSVAACPSLGVFTVSYCSGGCVHLVDVFDLDPKELVIGGGLQKRCTLGCPGSCYMGFRFENSRGRMAFTDATSTHTCLLLLADATCVHIIDVLSKTHMGFLYPPEYIPYPSAIAAQAGYVAVTRGYELLRTRDVVLFVGSGPSWVPHCIVASSLTQITGLSFASDRKSIVMCEAKFFWFSRLSEFRVSDGCLLGSTDHFETSHQDVVECEEGWLLACGGDEGGVWLYPRDRQGGCIKQVMAMKSAYSIAVVQGGCLCTGFQDKGSNHSGLYVLTSKDVIAMARMSLQRLGWLVAIVRSMLWWAKRKFPAV